MAELVPTMASTTRVHATEADLLRMPKDGRKYELVDGQIRVSPAGAPHGKVCVRLLLRLGSFAEERRLGHVFDSSTGFRLPGGNVRSPDLSFVARGRFPSDERVPEGFPNVAPDLAVEVLSPGDSSRDVLDKVGEYLQAGVRAVLVVDPEHRHATVYRSLADVRPFVASDDVDLGDVVPGFAFTLGDIFE